MSIVVRQAGAADFAALAPLLDGYRQAYGRPSDPAAAQRFLAEGLASGLAIVLLAEEDGAVAGYAQLYPVLSPLRAARTLHLGDLFVDPAFRGRDIGNILLDAARERAVAEGCAALTIATGSGNRPAQEAYEAKGFVRDDALWTYALAL